MLSWAGRAVLPQQQASGGGCPGARQKPLPPGRVQSWYARGAVSAPSVRPGGLTRCCRPSASKKRQALGPLCGWVRTRYALGAPPSETAPEGCTQCCVSPPASAAEVPLAQQASSESSADVTAQEGKAPAEVTVRMEDCAYEEGGDPSEPTWGKPAMKDLELGFLGSDFEHEQQEALFRRIWKAAGAVPPEPSVQLFPTALSSASSANSVRNKGECSNSWAEGVHAIGSVSSAESLNPGREAQAEAPCGSGEAGDQADGPCTPVTVRGAFATLDIPAGGLIMSVPLACCLAVPLTSPDSGRTRSGEHAPVALAVELIKALLAPYPDGETGGSGCEEDAAVPAELSSFWRVYARLLPSNFNSLLDLPDAVLSQLHSDSALTEIERRRRNQDMLAMEVQRAVGVSSRAALWALGAVLSRSFTACVEEKVHQGPSFAGASPQKGQLPVPGMSRNAPKGGPHGPESAAAVPDCGERTKRAEEGTRRPTAEQRQEEQRGPSLESQPRAAQPQPQDTGGSWFQILMPIVDMVNHSAEHSTTSCIPEDRAAFLPASASTRIVSGPTPLSPSEHPTGPISALRRKHWQLISKGALGKGDEVTISYGPLQSLTFLTSFGFLPSVNPSSKVVLYNSIQDLMDDMSKLLRLQRRKEEFLGSFLRTEAPFFASADGIASSAMDCLMLLYTENEELLSTLEDHLCSEGSLRHAKVEPMARSLAASQISGRCSELLKEYPTTIEEDLRELEGIEQRYDVAMGDVVRLRIQDKLVLFDCLSRYSLFT